MKKHYLLLSSILLFALGQVIASDPGLPIITAANSGNLSTSAMGFEENKGQVLTTDGDPAPFVRFVLASGNAKIFLLEKGIAYQFERMHYPEGYAELMADMHSAMLEHEQMEAMHAQVQRETFRMDMLLEGADPQPRISTEGRSLDYTNYYNRDVLNVHHYSKITYHDVYPGIDWLIYTTAKGMKYDFVVHPGADPDLIRLRLEHQEELYLDDAGDLIHGNRLGRFTEQRPVSYQGDVEVPSAFILEGNILRFSLGAYDRTRTLTIDPDRIWGTYYGGASHDVAYSCATDEAGNVYLAGTTDSSTDIASVGHQNTFGGGWPNGDAFLVKFNGNGVRQWSTYYGGSSSEFGLSCAVDGTGNIYLAGRTFSDTAISFQGHQDTFGGSWDGFLVKLNNSGIRQWATYYGGSGYDYCTGCCVDQNDNVFIFGYTVSEDSIASGGHQNVFGGLRDAFLVKFNSSGVRQWGTYYGGGSFDQGTSCATDGGGNVYLAGRTNSTNGIADGGHQNDYGGGSVEITPTTGDAFLAKFDPNGVREWATYYGGPGNEPLEGFCAVDDEGNVYLAGRTISLTAIASGGHQNTFGGVLDGFLVKFNGSGVRLWGTYYGGTGKDVILGVAAKNDDVFVAGLTTSTADIASGGFQNIYGGTYDCFLVKMNSSGVRQWSTYYGGPGVDLSNACAVDGNGDVYLAGETGSTSAIASNGHQNVFGEGERDGFLVKFEGGSTNGIFNTAGQPDANTLHLYPNPARNCWVTLTLSDPAFTGSTLVVIDLFDALGKRVHTERTTASGGELNHLLQLGEDLGAGLYSVVMSFGDVRWQRSIVIE